MSYLFPGASCTPFVRWPMTDRSVRGQYYPPNINRSRCCDQAICTECFVQIKRADPTTTHLVSEPASCPYCVQENFGVVYTPPSWRTGIGSEGAVSLPFPFFVTASRLLTTPHPVFVSSFSIDATRLV